MKKSDTNSEVLEHFDNLWRNLSPQERFLKGLKWILLSRQMVLAGIRARYPHFSEKEVREKLIQELYTPTS